MLNWKNFGGRVGGGGSEWMPTDHNTVQKMCQTETFIDGKNIPRAPLSFKESTKISTSNLTDNL